MSFITKFAANQHRTQMRSTLNMLGMTGVFVGMSVLPNIAVSIFNRVNTSQSYSQPNMPGSSQTYTSSENNSKAESKTVTPTVSEENTPKEKRC